MASESLSQVLTLVEQNRLVLPQFQRDFVWQPGAVKKLLASLLNNYPIGSLLLMENPGVYDFRSIDGLENSKPAEQETTLILDGQQRVTSCFRIFQGTINPKYRNAGRYYFDYGRFVADRRSGKEIEASEVEDYIVFEKPAKINKELRTTAAELTRGWLPFDCIFQAPRGSTYVEWLNQFTFDRAAGNAEEFGHLNKVQGEFATKYIQKVTGYQINYERITRDTNPDVICTIFETINTTGVKLTVFDLLVAKCFKKHIRLRDDLEGLLASNPQLQAFDVEGIDICESQLPRIISLKHNRQCKKGDILKLDPEIVGQKWQEATQALMKAVDIVRDRYGVPSAAYIPTQDIISPLAYIVSHPDFDIKKHGAKLDLWYWSLSFTQYLSGAPESKTAKECRDWFGGSEAWAYNDTNVPESCAGFEVDPEELHDATKTSGLYKSVFTLLIATGAFDLGLEPDGSRKELRQKGLGELEDHHVFPQRFLHNNGIKGAKANGRECPDRC